MLDRLPAQWRFTTRALLGWTALVAIVLGLMSRLGPAVLLSIPLAAAIGWIVGCFVSGIAGYGYDSRIIRCAILGAFIANFAVLLDSAVSPFASSGLWSLDSFMILAPVGAFCGAILASFSARGFPRTVLRGVVCGPVVGAIYVTAVFFLLRWRFSYVGAKSSPFRVASMPCLHFFCCGVLVAY